MEVEMDCIQMVIHKYQKVSKDSITFCIFLGPQWAQGDDPVVWTKKGQVELNTLAKAMARTITYTTLQVQYSNSTVSPTLPKYKAVGGWWHSGGKCCWPCGGHLPEG
jgi:hypothetical protein